MFGCLIRYAGQASRLTFDPADDNVPMWSADGLRIVWPSTRGGGGVDLYIKAANGTGKDDLLVKMGTLLGWASDWSRDGRYLLYQRPGEKTGQDLWIAPQLPEGASGDRKPFPYLQSQFDESEGKFSPDGRWVAYVSNESGRNEIYVQSFPLTGAKFQISSGGGAATSMATRTAPSYSTWRRIDADGRSGETGPRASGAFSSGKIAETSIRRTKSFCPAYRA